MIHSGTLTVTDAAGGLHTIGGKIPGPAVTMKRSDPGLYRSIVFNSELAAGEAYMDGTLTFPGSSLRAFLDLMSINRNYRPPTPIQRALGTVTKPFKRFQQANLIGRAQQNIAHHYDIGNALYRLFLDDGLFYSCAYFENDDDIRRDYITDVQRELKRHEADRLPKLLGKA